MTEADDGLQTLTSTSPNMPSTFAAPTATQDVARWNTRPFHQASPPPTEETPLLPHANHHDLQDGCDNEATEETRHGLVESISTCFSRMFHSSQSKQSNEPYKIRPGAFPRPVGGTAKLGTFTGVFVPVTLNVLSILMFLRFGFILGQTGTLGMLGMLGVCYAINLLTTMSISAIATNGTVRGGGAYYLISRSLGPEFGGSVGLVFYFGSVFSTSMNAVGLVDCLIVNFGTRAGSISHWLPHGYWWQFLWATAVLALCTLVCLAGSGLFARASNGLLMVLLIAVVSIPLSALVNQPFVDTDKGIIFTGVRWDTFRQNLLPHFTKDAAGSNYKGRENFQDLFGILFPATGGILAGASMSGDLKHPSKAIPKGTLSGLGLTFALYTLVILALAASVGRETFYKNTNVIQLTNISGIVVLLGELATSIFSVLMGVIGSAKLLQALARDHLIPGLSILGQGTKKSDDPIYAIVITYLIAQVTMFADINQIALFITMTYLMTFLVTNLACFLLDIGSAPNFRPSFHFFNWQTAALGTIVCGAAMFFVSVCYAFGCVVLLMTLFSLIHYTTPPKPWGDVSQGLIYHQVRKYLLRLRQGHVKFWRPQILLLVNDPRRQYKLIQFCNSLKKGGLFVLGHVIVSQDFGAAVPEARQQQKSWTKYIDFSKIKAFVSIVISPAVEWGARNLVLAAGLGSMRPNIVIMGFYNISELRQTQPLIRIPSPQPSGPSGKVVVNSSISRTATETAARKIQIGEHESLPTDAMRTEGSVGIQSYVTTIEDLVRRLQTNVAIAHGFQELEVPSPTLTTKSKTLGILNPFSITIEKSTKKYIDLWPIQMSTEDSPSSEQSARKHTLTTNFDTYTLILQLGCILWTVPSWKRAYKLRVCVFVEYETDVEEERGRVTALLKNLRIEAEVLVFWLAKGDLRTYEVIVNGKRDGEFDQTARDVDLSLEYELWWQDIKRLRQPEDESKSQELTCAADLLEAVTRWPTASFQYGRQNTRSTKRFAALQKMLRRTKQRNSAENPRESSAKDRIRNGQLPASLVSEHDSEVSFSDYDKGDEADDEAVITESGAAVCGSNYDEYNLDASDDQSGDEDLQRPGMSSRRAKTAFPSTEAPFSSAKLGLWRSIWKDSPKSNASEGDRRTTDSVKPLRPHPNAVASDTAAPGLGKTRETRSTASTSSQLSLSTRVGAQPPINQQSLPRFTSNPTPQTAVASQEAPGPSIMFVETPAPSQAMKNDTITTAVAESSAAATRTSSTYVSGASSPISSHTAPVSPYQSSPASGYPAQQTIPLSFNDLPCRAQHLILNELIRQQSDNTVVAFTTLPSPMEGTCKSEAESVKYVSDLEVLCQGLPPVLLVHSNSMTVTTNL